MKSNIRDEEDLADLTKAYNKRADVLETDSLEFAGQNVSEEEVIRDVLRDIQSSLRTSDRIVELPGLAANTELVVGAVSKFKEEVYTGNVKPAQIAGHDDIVVEFANAKVFNGLQTTSVTNFQLTGQSAGESGSIVPQNEGGDATLADEEWLLFTGDFIDLSADAIVTEIQYANVDGNTNLNPESVYLSERNTDMQISVISGQLIKSKVDINSYNAFAGDLELVPVAIHIAKGENVPGLTA